MLKQFFSLSFKGVAHRPMRSWLTILGIVIGVTFAVTILTLSSGIRNAVSSTLQMFGKDLVVVFPGEITNPFASLLADEKFKEKDLMALERIDGVEYVSLELQSSMTVEYEGQKESALIYGAPLTPLQRLLEETEGFYLEEGEWPKGDDVNEVILGHNAAMNLFDEKVRIGDEIIVKTKRFRMVGYFNQIGEQMMDNVVYMSIDNLRNLTGEPPVAISANVKVKEGANIDLVARQIDFELSKQTVVEEYSVLTPDKTQKLVDDVLEIIELVLVVIVFISLIVGAVGIMNTMYTSVLERTKQIGIMKAVGASNDSILSLFLLESGMIGLIGGLIGVILGVLFAFLIGIGAEQAGVDGLFAWSAIEIFDIVAVLIITFVVGLVSGIMPARQAGKMEPAEALRYE